MKIDILKKQIFSTIFPARISNILKYFLSETIHAQENGSRGTHFAKSLISNFLKGLSYSAMKPYGPGPISFASEIHNLKRIQQNEKANKKSN